MGQGERPRDAGASELEKPREVALLTPWFQPRGHISGF